MKRLLYVIISFSLAISCAMAAVDPSSLIKVTPDIKVKCVEYYLYQDAMYCSATVQSAKPADLAVKGYEKQKIKFDDRPWLVAWGENTLNMTTVEYIPNGENIDNWHELITSQFFPGLNQKATPREFADMMLEDLKKSNLNPTIKILEENNDQVLLEFRIETPADQQQDELQLIRKGSDGIYVVHYAILQADMGEKNRAKWINLLKQVK